jgi:multidrug resistance efflux pump
LKVAEQTLLVRQQEVDLLKAGTRAEEIAQAQAALDEATAAADLAEHGYRAEDVAQAKASVDQAQAALAVIAKQLDELSVKSPVNGRIESVELRPGDIVGPNAPVLSILDNSELWVRAYVPENRLNLAIGKKLSVTVDSFPNRKFAGHVSFVARQAEFTPNNVQTPEERSKQVFRIKVTMDEGLDVLRPGMAADVWLEGK